MKWIKTFQGYFINLDYVTEIDIDEWDPRDFVVRAFVADSESHTMQRYLARFDSLEKADRWIMENILEENVDKLIRKVEKDVMKNKKSKAEKDIKVLKKADKKMDAKVEKCDSKMKMKSKKK